MKCAIELTEAEKALKQLSRKYSHQDLQIRGPALLELADGRRVHEIAVELDECGKSECNGEHSWRDRSPRGLLAGYKGGRSRALSDALITIAIGSSPRRIDDAQADCARRRAAAWSAFALPSRDAVGAAQADGVFLKT